MATTRALFSTVAEKDYLGFWADQTLNARSVVDFLDLDKRDVAKLGSCPRTWCTSREFRFGWTRAQLTTADNRAG